MNFSIRLRELRKEHNLTQKEVAKVINVTIATISKYELGIIEPDHKATEILADYFDVSIDYLLGRTNERRLVMYKNFQEYLDSLKDEENKEDAKEDYSGIKNETERKDYHVRFNIAYPSIIKESNAEYDVALEIAKSKSITPEKLQKILDAL